MNKKLISVLACAVLAVAACGGSDVSEGDSADSVAGATTQPAASTATTDGATPTVSTAVDSTETSDAPTSTEASGSDDGVLNVPDEFDTIQAAVDAASPGDLVLIAPGVYHEAVDVVTDEIVIRGLEREGVVLDGEFDLDNGIRVLGAKGVAVENLTTQNYTQNGVFFTSVDGYRASYITAYRVGDYGVYAFDSVNGQIENSYGAGSPDAGFYIGQCYPCNAVIDNVLAEHNGLGYSGTNSGGDLYIINSEFRNNRAGIVPNSGSYELCYPERRTTIIGNRVTSNNQPDTPAIDVAILAMGNGILTPGGVANVIERNYVDDHDKTGIGLVPFLEEGPNDDLPTDAEWDVTCADARNEPLASEIPDVLLWDPFDNEVRDNVVTNSRVADLGVAGVGVETSTLRNCWSGNTFTTSRPAAIETVAPCGGDALAGDDPAWTTDPLDVFAWLDEVDSRPPSVDYETAELPPIPDLDDMPDAATAPAEPATDMPRKVDFAAITTPRP